MPSVTVNLTRLDIAIGTLRVAFRHPVNLAVFGLLWLLLVIGRKQDPDLSWLVNFTLGVGSGLFMSLVCFLVGVVAMLVGVIAFARSDRGVLGEHVFRIVEQGLVESTKVNESLMKWGGVRSVTRTRRYIYVRVTMGMAHIIPRRFFADTAADDELWNALQPLVAKKVS